MASSEIQIVPDSTTESEAAVAEPAENTNTVTIDNVFTASMYGDLEKLRKFAEEDGASLSLPDNDYYDGAYPLHLAAATNYPQIVQYIIEHGGDVNAVDKSQRTALHWAAGGGSISPAGVLLQNGARVEAADVDGCRVVEQDNASLSWTADDEGADALHMAAADNRPEIVQYLIEHGGDVNAVDNTQRTSLHWAAEEGWISVADVLLQNGARVEAADVNGYRAVHFAAQYGQTSFLNHIVAKHYVDFDVPDNDGRSPLHWAAARGFVDTVKWLLSKDASQKRQNKQEEDGASLSLADNNGACALHLAALNNHPEIVQYIIEHGGDVNAVDNSQKRALHYAASSGSISVADVLLQNGASVGAASVMGFRAVHLASQYGQTLFLEHIVVKHNADFDVRDIDGGSPLHWSALNNFPEIAQYIIEHGGDVNAVDNYKKTALHWAAVEGRISVADMLLQNGALVEAVDVNGYRAVHLAAQKGQTSFLNHIVVNYNADFDVPDNDGMTPLHKAALNNFPETVQYIIEHGGDVNAVDHSQRTALHLAVVKGGISVANMLLQNGALVEAADVEGYRAVHFAAIFGQTSFLEHIVVKHNADFDIPDNGGRSPLYLAAYKGFVDIVRWLLSRGASQKRLDITGRAKEELLTKDREGNTPIQLVPVRSRRSRAFLLSKALQEECKHLQNSNLKGVALQKGRNRPMIIAMQGDNYTGKSVLAMQLAWRLQCTIVSLDDFLDATEATDEQDTLISHTFNLIAQVVKMQILPGHSVVVDSSLSRLSHLQSLVSLVSPETTDNAQLLIIECKPENEYAYQLRFEERDSAIYRSSWYKPAAVWPLPKLPRDYTDNDIPPGVSKLVVDTNDHYSSCQVLKAILDVTSCGYGHITKYDDYWQVIHTDKSEQFTCPCCNTAESLGTVMDDIHKLTFHEEIDHCDKLCGICDNKVLGSCYTFKDCPLTLHKSCAELAHGDKKYFVPESFPMFMSTKPHVTYAFPVERPCADCRKDGNGFSSKCKHCLFESHLKSRLLPTVVLHRAHDHFLTLWLNLHASGSTHRYMCLACRKYGKLAAYVLDEYNMYHPECVLLPPSVHHTHGGHTHNLEMVTHREEKMEDYICDCCSNKMDPTAWYYYCSKCIISVHLECAFQDFDSGGSITKDCHRNCMCPWSMH